MNPSGVANNLRETSGLIRLIWQHPENRRRRARALARFFAWQVWERTVGRPWTIHLTPDRILRCYPHSAGASGVLYCRLLEWRESRFVLDYLQPGDVFLDVGANIGVYSLLASTRPGVDVMAFEPSAVAFQRLGENIALNDLHQIRPFNLALGEADGRGYLTTNRDTTNRLLDSPTGSVDLVAVRALDSLLDDRDMLAVSLVKVDVEGHEIAVLHGAGKLLAGRGPALIVERNQPAELGALLTQLGYKFFRYEPEGRRLFEIDVDEPEVNLIALRDGDGRLKRAGSDS